MKTKSMVICAVFSAILCIFCVLTVPIGAVPVSLATFAVMLTAIILGPKKSSISVIIYILLGSVGLPVFSGFRGGFQVLIGPTGGYIWSYIFMALLIGSVTEKCVNSKPIALVGCIFGTVICYIFGTVQFVLVQNTSFISVGQIAEEADMELDEFLEMYDLPEDMPSNTTEAAAYNSIPFATMAGTYGMTADDLKELLQLPETVTDETTWGEALNQATLGAYVGADYLEEFKEYYGLGEDVTAETTWGEVRQTVEEKQKEERIEAEKAEKEAAEAEKEDDEDVTADTEDSAENAEENAETVADKAE